MTKLFYIFTWLADLIVYRLMGLSAESHWAASLHFFIEDVTKIFALLFVLIYCIGLGRASLNVERVRDFLAGKHRFFGYVLAALFGAVTPFCSCSSIPLFLGFTAARIPVGITMAFLITSPMINEVAIVLLGSMLGVQFTVMYVTVGMLAGIIGGVFFDSIGAEKHLTDLAGGVLAGAKDSQDEKNEQTCCAKADDQPTNKMSWRERHDFARSEVFTIISRIWKWIFIGIGVGAALHGFVPREWIVENLGSGQWWTVPSAVLLGIPLYSNASGVIPVAQTLLNKGLPVGTTLAFMMSTVAASFPEFVLLKQVMKPKMLLMFFILLLVLFSSVGWLFNLMW